MNPMNALRLKNRLRQLARWLWSGRYHLLSAAAFVVTVLYLTGVATFCPKVVALLMALTGLVIILTQQILDASKFSAHRPTHRPYTVMNWLKSFPTGKSITPSLRGAVVASSSVKARASVSVAPDATIERKIEFLLRQLESLDAAFSKLDDRVDSIKSTLGQTEKKLQASIDTLTKSMDALVAGHVLGSYDLNLFGVNITICGTVIQFFTG
jgi:hypothetical protein